MQDIHTRLHARLDKSGECWLWQGCKAGNGYGQISVGGRLRPAHRVAYELAHGPVPDGAYVCHRCDVPLCCNPAHLFAGTNSDNQRDCNQKGRHGGAKVTPEVATLIVARHREGASAKRLARELNISDRQIRDVIHGRHWTTRPEGTAP